MEYSLADMDTVRGRGMQERGNVFYLSSASREAEAVEPDAIGIILIWANQMILEGHMPEHVQVAFHEHFSFFVE
jgi:hypothetical protein